MFRYTVTTIVIILYYFTLDSSLLLDFWYGEMFVFTSHQKDDCSSVCLCVSCTVGRLSGSTFVCLCVFLYLSERRLQEKILDGLSTLHIQFFFFLFFLRFFFLSLLWVFCLRFYLLLRSPVRKKETSLFVWKIWRTPTYINTYTPSNSITKVEIQDKSFKYRQFVENVQIKCLSVIFLCVCLCVCVCPYCDVDKNIFFCHKLNNGP